MTQVWLLRLRQLHRRQPRQQKPCLHLPSPRPVPLLPLVTLLRRPHLLSLLPRQKWQQQKWQQQQQQRHRLHWMSLRRRRWPQQKLPGQRHLRQRQRRLQASSSLSLCRLGWVSSQRQLQFPFVVLQRTPFQASPCLLCVDGACVCGADACASDVCHEASAHSEAPRCL